KVMVHPPAGPSAPRFSRFLPPAALRACQLREECTSVRCALIGQDLGTVLRRPEAAELLERRIGERMFREKLAPKALDEMLPKLPSWGTRPVAFTGDRYAHVMPRDLDAVRAA